MKRSLTATALFLCAGLVACQSDTASQSGNVAEKVTREPSDGPLYSTKLKSAICSEIESVEGEAAAPNGCEGFTFTVTEVARSTKFGYLGQNKAISMQMKVAVLNPDSNASYSATLTRQVTAELDLVFKAELEHTDLQIAHDFIRQVAEDAGEYPDWSDPDLASRTDPVSFTQMPSAVQDAIDDALELAREYNADHNGSAGYGQTLSIVMDGKVVGYIGEVDDDIDDPLWDGSGLILYLDPQGTTVTETSWSG